MKFLSLIVLTMLACQNGFADKIFVPSGTAGDATTSVVAPNSNLLDFDWTTNNQAFTQGSTPAFKTVDEAVVFYQNYREMMKKRTMANMVSNFPIAENAWCLRYYDAYGFNAPIEGDRYQFNCLAGHGDIITHAADFDMRASISSSSCPTDENVRAFFNSEISRTQQMQSRFNQTMESNCIVSASFTYPSRPYENVQKLDIKQINSILSTKPDLNSVMTNSTETVKLAPGKTSEKVKKRVNPLPLKKTKSKDVE